MLRSFFLLALVAWVGAFAPMRPMKAVSTETSTITPLVAPFQLAKKAATPPPEQETAVDAGTVLRWLSPLNPYMLFVYPLLFIFAVDFFGLGPSSH